MKRDLSEDQFVAKIAKLGGEKGFMGYVTFRWDDGSKHGGNVSINRHNAGERRRDQLRYLTRELTAHKAADARLSAAHSEMTTARAQNAADVQAETNP